MAQAKSLESASPQAARDAYYHAWHNFSTGRWPSEKLSPGKQKAYVRSLDAFQNYGKLLDPPIETVRFAFEGKQVTGITSLTQAHPSTAQSGPPARVVFASRRPLIW